MAGYAFYTVADSAYFIGLVAMINSLRLVGHYEQVFVADCGLSESQRGRIADHVTIVETSDIPAPALAKVIAPVRHPADVMILIDADMIVTRSLATLVEDARPGRVVAMADEVPDRFDEQWSEVLGLGPLRRQTYLNAGLVVAEREICCRLLAQIAAGFPAIEVERSVAEYGSPDYTFYFLEQDIMNATLATYPEDVIVQLDLRLAPHPPFSGLRLIDEATLRCGYGDGVEPFVLHHVARKPWLRPTRWNLYSHLLARLLLSDDVAVPLGREELPLRLRRGSLAWLEKRRATATVQVNAARARLALRTRVRRLRGR
jgi:hypothetical protein